MEIWQTWLGYFGLICGLVAAAVLQTSALRSAAIGFVAGLVLVILWNVVAPSAAPCLQSSTGWDILRAHSLSCGAKEPLAQAPSN
jgi:hypothetical protein